MQTLTPIGDVPLLPAVFAVCCTLLIVADVEHHAAISAHASTTAAEEQSCKLSSAIS
jgi:hypothetical protein